MVSVGAPAAYLSVGAPAAYPRLLKGDGFTVLPRMVTMIVILPRMTTTTTTQRSQRDTWRATHAQPDRNAVTLSIAVGSQNLRIGRKGKRETTLKGSPNTANGAPLQGAYITPYMVSVGAPAAYPRLLKGDGFTVLPDRNATGPGRDSSTTARPSWPSTPTSPGESTPPDDAPEYDDYLG